MSLLKSTARTPTERATIYATLREAISGYVPSIAPHQCAQGQTPQEGSRNFAGFLVGFSLLAGFLLACARKLCKSGVQWGERRGHAKAQLCTRSPDMRNICSTKPVFDPTKIRKQIFMDFSIFFSNFLFSFFFSPLLCKFLARLPG